MTGSQIRFRPARKVNVKVKGKELSLLERWAHSVQYLCNGSADVISNYSDETPYAIRTQANYYVMVASKKHMKELAEAPELSLRAAFGDIFGFKYTLNSMDVNSTTKADRGIAARVLQSIAVQHLPAMQEGLQRKLSETLSNSLRHGKQADGWISLPLSSTIRNLIFEMNCLSFFGERFASDPEFLYAAWRYPVDTIIAGEVLQFVPTWVAPYVHGIITQRNRAMKILSGRLMSWVTDRKEKGSDKTNLEHTMVQWMIDSAKGDYWTPENLVRTINGVWFASSHQVWMTVEMLPLLDSFMKEVSRMNAFDSVAVRRKALQSFTFSDGGPHIPIGNVACVPQMPILLDAKNYSCPMDFNGFRFASKGAATSTTRVPGERTSTFTDVTEIYPIWGYGSWACPGRFYASFIMKLVLIHIIMNYDFRLEDPHAPRTWSWRTFRVPYERARMMFRARRD
ncbi:hypothetical protein MMC22_007863 [Lobaria immixta]|nr:hypothetical protein [Lobaria immixta]